MNSAFVAFGICAFALAACRDPTRSIQPDIAAFLRETPNNFYHSRLGERSLRAAWAGQATLRPLVLVHGSPGSWRGWAAFLRNQDLQRRFHVIAVDRPGYGGSGAGHAERSLESQARAVSLMLGENRSGQGAILVGHSMGGPVAARVAMDFPDRVSGLVLLSSSVDPDLEETKWFQIPAEWLLLKWLVPRDLKVCNEEILALRGELNKLRPEWEKLDVPVAVVHGELDDLVPVGNVDFLKRHLKSSSLVDLEILPGMNHFVPWERSDAVLNAIRLVSEKVPPGP